MLNLFIQVPLEIRMRLANRCKELYEYAWQERVAGEGGEDGEEDPQVGGCSLTMLTYPS